MSFASAITPPLGQGAQVGPYEVVGHLATGGMGEVYLARKRGIGGFERTVVLKVMLPHLAQDERFARMFVDEARIASGLSHPNIVQVHDLGTSQDGALYLAMEHLQGVSVIACMKSCAQNGEWVPQEVAARAICDAATGLAYAHAATNEEGEALGLVHRDVSPENLFLTYAGPTKLLDFGVAKVRGRLAETQAGEFKGKVGYMAPEIIRGQEPDARADLFSLGVVLFELLTGRRLFHAAVPATALHRVLSAPVPDVRTLRSDVDDELARFVARLLDRNKRRRIATAEETADLLETWLANRPGTIKHVSRWLQERFADAHALSATIAKAVERTGQIDPAQLREARRLNGDALADTVVRELSDSERQPGDPVGRGGTSLTAGSDTYDGFEPDGSWIRQESRIRGFLLVVVVLMALGVAMWLADQRLTPEPARAWGRYVQDAVLFESALGSLVATETRDGQRHLVVAEPKTTKVPLALAALEDIRRQLIEIEDPGLPVPASVGVEQGRAFAAYPLEAGRSLATLLDEEFVAADRGLAVLRGVAEVMAVAEDGELVHGWLTPELIWITDTDQVRVFGFRGARPVIEGALGRTPLEGAALAPELTTGLPAASTADQYALAAILAEALPKVDQRSAVATATVLARALAVEPRARYESTEAFVTALERALRRARRRR